MCSPPARRGGALLIALLPLLPLLNPPAAAAAEPELASGAAPESASESASESAPIVREADFLAVTDPDLPGGAPGPGHPALRAAAVPLEIARAERLRAALLPAPGVGAQVEAPDGLADETTLTLSWAPPLDGRRRLRVAAAEAGVGAARHRVRRGRLEVRREMRAAFARWAMAHRRSALLDDWGARLAALAARSRRRAEAGEVSGLEARRLALSAAEVGARRARAEAELAEARAAARAWRPDLERAAVPAVTALPGLPPPTELPHSEPLVAALRAELEAARLGARLARRVVPFPELSAGWKRVDDRAGVFEGPVFGLAWSLPLGAARPRRLAADAAVETAAARLELARWRTDAARNGLREAYRGLRQRAAGLAADAREAAPAVRAAEAAFRLGEEDLTALLETLRSAVAVEMALLDLTADALAAHRRLEALVGRPLHPIAPSPDTANPDLENPDTAYPDTDDNRPGDLP